MRSNCRISTVHCSIGRLMPTTQLNYGLVQAGEKGIGGGVGPAQEGQPGLVTFYIEVPDIKAKLAEIETAGGKTVMSETVIPNMVTFGLFADPEGNVVGVVKSEN